MRNAEEVQQGFDRIMAAALAAHPAADIRGIEVQEMVTQGVEIIIGLLDDPQFGPVIMFGLGGVLTEVLHDVSFRVLPITDSDARQMIRELKGYKVLQGYRGQPPVSEDMLVDLLLNAVADGDGPRRQARIGRPEPHRRLGRSAPRAGRQDHLAARASGRLWQPARPAPTTSRPSSRAESSRWSAPRQRRARSATACSIAW